MRGAIWFMTAARNACRSIRGHEGYRALADRPDAREKRSGGSRYRRTSVLSSFVRLRRQALEPLGPLEPFPNCSEGVVTGVRPPALGAGGTEDGDRHRALATRRSVWCVTLGSRAGAGTNMGVIHPNPIDGDGTCWLGVPPTPGMTAPDENRRVSD